MNKTYVLNENELDTIVHDILDTISNGVIILRGDLAAGKTTFVKAIAKSLGYTEDVTSPTFSLQQCYGDKLFHYDIYNHGLEHFLSLGMLEELDKDGLHFIEWGNDTLIKMLIHAGINTITIDISKLPNDARKYNVCTH